jgi:hypothetical protein
MFLPVVVLPWFSSPRRRSGKSLPYAKCNRTAMLRQFKPRMPVWVPCFTSKAEKGMDVGGSASSPAPPRASKQNAVRSLLFCLLAAASSLHRRCRLRGDAGLPLSHQGDGEKRNSSVDGAFHHDTLTPSCNISSCHTVSRQQISKGGGAGTVVRPARNTVLYG